MLPRAGISHALDVQRHAERLGTARRRSARRRRLPRAARGSRAAPATRSAPEQLDARRAAGRRSPRRPRASPARAARGRRALARRGPRRSPLDGRWTYVVFSAAAGEARPLAPTICPYGHCVRASASALGVRSSRSPFSRALAAAALLSRASSSRPRRRCQQAEAVPGELVVGFTPERHRVAARSGRSPRPAARSRSGSTRSTRRSSGRPGPRRRRRSGACCASGAVAVRRAQLRRAGRQAAERPLVRRAVGACATRASTAARPEPTSPRPAAWDVTTGGPVTVAVVDTGVAYEHPDLARQHVDQPGRPDERASTTTATASSTTSTAPTS